MQAKGNSRASVRFIEQATGLSKGIILKACRELVEWGYMTQRTGIGTRPTEYSPNWSSVSPASNANSNLSSVPLESNASVPLESNTTDFSVPPVSNESYLLEPAYKAGLQVSRNIDTHDASPTAGLASAAAGPRDPEEKKKPFDKFWQTFPRKYQKPKARAVWDKLNPSDELADHIIKAASLWAAHYEAYPVDKKWMPSPANWLAGERYDEDLPEIYEDPKERAISKAKDRPKRSANVDFLTAGRDRVGKRVINIVDSDVKNDSVMILDFCEQDVDFTWKHEIAFNTPAGKDELDALCRAKGVNGISDSSELHGLVYVQTTARGPFFYSPVIPTHEEITATIARCEYSYDDRLETVFLDLEFNEESGLGYECITVTSSNEDDVRSGRIRIDALAASLGLLHWDSDTNVEEWAGMQVRVLRNGEDIIEWLPRLDVIKEAA